MSADFKHSAYAEQRRELKAVAIETAVAGLGKTSADVRAFAPKDRRWFERIAGVRPASDETWNKVIALLESAERSASRQVTT